MDQGAARLRMTAVTRTRRPHRAGRPWRRWLALAIALPILLLLLWFVRTGLPSWRLPRPPLHTGRTVSMTVTAYCPCGNCCGWERNRYGRPVYSYGRSRGAPKAVGVCADGTRAAPGTIAADTRHYPFGTVMYVPGYGYGVVHDRGGMIKGADHIDVFFRGHRQARHWGRQRLQVVVFPPSESSD